MSARAALLRAVIESPDDDTPRLVFADWLDEHGTAADAARAEFIRLEIEADRLPADSPERAALAARAADLLLDYADVWERELPGANESGIHLRYRRGFVEDAELPAWWHVRNGARLFDAAPITTLRLKPEMPRGRTGRPWVLGHAPWLARVTALILADNILDASLDAIPDAEGLPPAESFMLNELLDCPTLTRLRRLALSESALSYRWVIWFLDRLPRASFFPTLTALDLSGCRLLDVHAQFLCVVRELQNIRELTLDGRRLEPDTLRFLRQRFGNGLAIVAGSS